MNEFIKAPIRTALRRLGYAAVDLSKDVATAMLLPGHIKNSLERLSINCVMDVGANRGDYAVMLRRIGYRGLIVSIEPVREVYESLAQRAAPDPKWKVLNYALGDKNELKQINVCTARNLSSFFRPAEDIGEAVLDAEIDRTEIVRVKCLDEVLCEVLGQTTAPRVWLKMDTQGYDLRVMDGAARALPLIVAIQSELSVVPLYSDMPDYVEALIYFRKLGFSPTGFFSVVGHRTTGRLLEFDAVLSRTNARA